ncbi:MAG: AAA family ATPase, partial [Marinobacter sp.]
MAKSLFIAPTSMGSGLTSVCLGLLRAMERVGISVGFYKPFYQSVNQGESQHNNGKDSSVTFVRSRSHLQPPDPITLKEAQQLLNRGKSDLLMETVVGEYQKVAKDVDVVIIEGLVPDRSEAYIARLNVEVARNLGSDVVLVSTPGKCSPAQLDADLDFAARVFSDISAKDAIAVILNKLGEPERSGLEPYSNVTQAIGETVDYQSACSVFRDGRFRLLAEIPWQAELMAPRVSDIARELNVPVLHEGQMLTRRVQRVSVCARSIRNMTQTLG